MRKMLRCSIVTTAGLAFLVATLMVLSSAGESFAGGKVLKRLSSNTVVFDSEALNSSGTGSPVLFFTRTLSVPRSINTLYVTLAATGDGHSGAAHLLNCKVDGVNCTDLAAPSAPTGWLNLQKHDTGDDFHDNNINYTWCTPIAPKTTGSNKAQLKHTVELRLATSSVLDDVFLEQAHVIIDGNTIDDSTDACSNLDGP